MMVDLASALTSFEAWRSARKNGKQKIPANLWTMACELSIVHGSAQVAKMLRLNHSELKRRVGPIPGSKGGLSHPPTASVRVTPLLIHDPRTQTPANREPQLVAELIGSNGLRLRIFEGASSEVVKALISQALGVK